MSRKPVVLFAIVLWTITSPIQAAPPLHAPEIFSLVPNEGPAGQEIQLKGSALEETRHVYFCVGRIVREAKFSVVSANELQVIAPRFFHSDATATIVVQSTGGVTVGMPASASQVNDIESRPPPSAFHHVMKNGVLTSPTGIVFIEDGGIADAPLEAGLCFVKNGGKLLDLFYFKGLLFAEPLASAVFDSKVRAANNPILKVSSNELTISAGIEPFLFKRPINPNSPPQSAPSVTSIVPHQVDRNSILTFHGHGFLGTSAVHLLQNSKSTVAYRVVSDHELEVEFTDGTNGFPLFLVENPKGATVVVSRLHLIGAHVPGGHIAPVHVVRHQTDEAWSPGRSNYFIENGGNIAHTSHTTNYFVKRGGRISLNSASGSPTVFCEDKADIEGVNTNGGNNVHQVASLNLSVLSKPVEIRSP